MALMATDATDEAGWATSLGEQLSERLRAEEARLLCAVAEDDELQVQISQAEIEDLRALAARNDICAA